MGDQQQFANGQPQQNQYNYGQNPYQYQGQPQTPPQGNGYQNPQYGNPYPPQGQPYQYQPQQNQYQNRQYQYQPQQNQYYYAPQQVNPVERPAKVLLVLSILLIIGGIVNLVIQFNSLRVMTSYGYTFAQLLRYFPLALIGTLLIIIGAVFQLLAGIFGIINRKKPSKITLNIVFISIQIALFLIGQIMIAIFNGARGINILNIITSFFLPVYYLVTCIQIKNAGK